MLSEEELIKLRKELDILEYDATTLRLKLFDNCPHKKIKRNRWITDYFDSEFDVYYYECLLCRQKWESEYPIESLDASVQEN